MTNAAQLIPDVVLSLGKAGIMVEFPVGSEAAPFLVSSAKDFFWLETAHQGVIRSAVRAGGLPTDTYLELVTRVRDRGLESLWGNIFSLDEDGVLGAVDYLQSYGLEDFDLLTGPGVNVQVPDQVRVVPAPWLPETGAVLVPRDRSYLGLVGIFKNSYTVVLHNPSRGMAILGRW